MCPHDSVSDRDDEGWVICFDCAEAIKRPLSMDEIVDRIEEHGT